MKTKYTILCIVIVIIAGLVAIFARPWANVVEGPSLKIGKEKITLIVSDTPEEREKGLGDLELLPENSVMLFTFENPDKYGIWMKDMKFPIDIIWLDESKKIVTIESDVSPDTYPEIFYPTENSFYVIESNAGFAEKNNLRTGDTLDFSL